jgi:tRNA dimethylallyltransferase
MIVNGNQLIHTYLYKGVPHFFIDTIHPSKQYSLAHFLADFRDFCTSHNLPKYLILCGGTGLYIKAILDRYSIFELSSEHEEAFNTEKSRLEGLSLADLQQLYEESITNINLNESDSQNARRLVNKILNSISEKNNWGKPILIPEFALKYNFAIKYDQSELYQKIKQRILDRVDMGMIEEVQALEFLGTTRLISLGLEYRVTKLYLLGQLTYNEYLNKLTLDSINYAQKQLTWLNKQGVTWVANSQEILDKMQMSLDTI